MRERETSYERGKKYLSYDTCLNFQKLNFRSHSAKNNCVTIEWAKSTITNRAPLYVYPIQFPCLYLINIPVTLSSQFYHDTNRIGIYVLTACHIVNTNIQASSRGQKTVEFS